MEPGPVQKSSTGILLFPLLPSIFATVERTIRGQMLSPDGVELHKLPPNPALDWICIPPINSAASINPGKSSEIFGSSYIL